MDWTESSASSKEELSRSSREITTARGMPRLPAIRQTVSVPTWTPDEASTTTITASTTATEATTSPMKSA